MQPADLELVAGVLGDAALASIAGPEQYFRDLVTRAELPAAFRAQLAGFGGGDPRASAIRLVRWADTQGTNPGDKRYTTLGSLLEVLLDDVGVEAATGLVAVLVSSGLVLTNYHVLAMEPGADPNAMAGDAVLRFGCVTAAEGKEAEGQTFRLDDPGPVVRLSRIEELDFALLRAEAGIRGASDLRPIEFTGKGVLAKGMGLNILQHPAGGPMEMGFSSNGITDIYDDI